MRLPTGLAVALALSGALATASQGATIPHSVIGSGATDATGSDRRLQGTVGQTAVGSSTGPSHASAHGFWTFGPPATTAVDPREGDLSSPTTIEFSAPTPNPSHGALAFTIGLPQAATVSLQVADVRGRLVAPPTSWSLTAGRHRIAFDPARNAEVVAGIYFARLVVDGQMEGVRRFVRVR